MHRTPSGESMGRGRWVCSVYAGDGKSDVGASDVAITLSTRAAVPSSARAA